MKMTNIYVFISHYPELRPGIVETEIFARGGGQEFSDQVLKSLTVCRARELLDSGMNSVSTR